ncbi:hypothetical protein [Vagococcus intermedius]|uniref:Uncharacterized protein n=1 Tax=Vagococcus intermedius TaxID=2991418 RepID=A0AAF0CT56_9ENTE|nr:hypothetical protein [Vagococcus intermedius]WEG72475.1 hypothetical protein OL234_05670 [Vagococcus intermedius]WEG74562.1 hypothetical protein OL235_05675 [Vagococcus intermedius]
MFELDKKKIIYKVVWQEGKNKRQTTRFMLTNYEVTKEELMTSLIPIFEKELIVLVSIEREEEAWLI